MARLSDKEDLLNDFRREVNDCCRVLTTHWPLENDNGHPNNHEIVGNISVVRDVYRRLGQLARSLRYAKAGGLLDEEEYIHVNTPLNELIGRVSELAQRFTRTVTEDAFSFRSPRDSRSTSRGSPKYDITELQLRFLLNCRFNKTQIASILHVSAKTVSRRLRAFGLAPEKYSNISDEDLDVAVKSVMMGNRYIGANSVRTRLRNNGIWTQRERTREALRRVDPAGVALRSRRVVKRKSYQVMGPNSLWHLDGNHKLIRWRIVIHGGIDGYSRLITFMDASVNNQSSTVLKLFGEATRQWGIPSRVRTDHGGENALVWLFMEEYHGPERGSAIRGRSVHNQRIERNWLDMWYGCTNVYYDLFTALERANLLNPNSEQQMFALHFVYLPRLRHALGQFLNQWNHHSLRTAHSLSPIQLFVQRSLALHGSLSTASGEIFERSNIELFHPQEIETEGEHPNVPSTDIQLTREQMQRLRGDVNPLAGIDSGDLGIDKYFRVLDLLAEMVDY